MKQFSATVNSDLSDRIGPCVATIGFFDGVHRGHKFLIGGVMDSASRLGLQSTVITFDRHPRIVLHKDYRPRLLTTCDEKLKLLAATGADNCVVLHFDEATSALSAYGFMKDVLRSRLNVRMLVTGYDNRFGHDRAEGFDSYVGYGRELGVDVVRAEAFTLNGVQVSSSVVRSFLSAGEVSMATMCLGYEYSLAGTVVEGCREGRRLGFPTANIVPDDSLKLIPGPGVYAVRVEIDGDGRIMPGMMNIGSRPTFGGDGMTLEVNIFGFSGDIYGNNVSVSFCTRLRDERKFGSAVKLAEQLAHDRAEAEAVLSR